MIFGSLGLLVVAGGLLAAGIAKSSTGYLALSFIATAAAGVLLLATYATARSRAISAGGAALPPAGFPGGAVPGGVPGTQPVVMYLPVSQVPGALQAVGAPGSAPGGNGGPSFPGVDNAVFAPATPFLGYDDMTADQVVKLIGSGALTVEQLEALRRYETQGQARKTVLDRLDRAIR